MDEGGWSWIFCVSFLVVVAAACCKFWLVLDSPRVLDSSWLLYRCCISFLLLVGLVETAEERTCRHLAKEYCCGYCWVWVQGIIFMNKGRRERFSWWRKGPIYVCLLDKIEYLESCLCEQLRNWNVESKQTVFSYFYVLLYVSSSSEERVDIIFCWSSVSSFFYYRDH